MDIINPVSSATIQSAGGVIETVGTFTPVVTFATPGNLSVAYSRQFGAYRKHGRLVTVVFGCICTTFTHTTAVGDLQITGMPFTSGNFSAFNVAFGSMQWAGITKASYTDVAPYIAGNSTTLGFVINGSGQPSTTVAVGDVPTGGIVVLAGTITYMTDA